MSQRNSDDSHSRSYMRTVLLITCVTAVGGFLFGFDNGAISGGIHYIEERFSLDAGEVGWVTSSLIVGTILGVLVSGRLSDRYGRKKILLGTAAIFAIGALGESLAPNPEVLIVFRVLVGIGIGVETTIAPLYIAEVAPAKMRGRLVSFNQLFNTVGNLAIFATAAAIVNTGTEAWLTQTGWRWMFATGLAPAVLFFALLFLVPESPRWLARQGRLKDSLNILRSINPSEEFAKSQLEEFRSDQQGYSVRASDLFAPHLRKPLVIGFGVALFQQITGINAIFYYAPNIFRDAGFDSSSAMNSTVLIGLTLVAATLLSIWLIDKAGRRVLLIIGSSGQIVTLGVVGLSFQAGASPSLLVLLVLAFVAVNALTFGTVAYVIISEIFPTYIRGTAASVATLGLWGGNFLVARFFPVMVQNLGSAFTFYIFAGLSVLALIFALALVPETKGRTLEEIEVAMATRGSR